MQETDPQNETLICCNAEKRCQAKRILGRDHGLQPLQFLKGTGVESVRLWVIRTAGAPLAHPFKEGPSPRRS